VRLSRHEPRGSRRQLAIRRPDGRLKSDELTSPFKTQRPKKLSNRLGVEVTT
jgi:hypothetical protein